MKSIENFKNQEVTQDNQIYICGGTTHVVSVANSNLDTVLNLIR